MKFKFIKNKRKRFWEIDFLRGIAVILMIVYHFLFDVSYFGDYSIDVNSGIFWIIGRGCAVMFLTLVGVSLTVSYSRTILKYKEKKTVYKKYILRGLKIFLLGLIITIFTWIIFPKSFIMFGILHLIGVSIILSILCLRLTSIDENTDVNKRSNIVNLLLGFVVIIIGIYLSSFSFDFDWLFWLGFAPYHLNTFDYFPIFPWFGFVLIGIFLGNKLYSNYSRRFRFINNPNKYITNALNFMGRHSLIIYFIHQPILMLILHLFGIVSFF